MREKVMLQYNEVGKVALITGGERGIGKGIVLRLAEAGYDIFTTYYFKSEAAEALKQQVSSIGRKCEILKADFRITEEVESVVKKTVKKMRRLDLVVNNAAIMPPRQYQYEYTSKHIDDVYSVNYRAYMLIMRDALRYWIKNKKKGNIVNISSESAICAHQKFSLYGGLKAAIVRSSTNVALDVAPYGIRVNCVLPGLIDSKPIEEAMEEGIPMKEIEHTKTFAKEIPLQRAGMVRDIGNAVVWLASEDASYITGVSLVVDGGLTLTGMTNMSVAEDEDANGVCTIKRLTEEEMQDW